MTSRPSEDSVRLTTTECGVLGLLSLGEASGYDLLKLADRSVGLIWRPVKSQLYTLLPQFVERGFVEARAVPQDRRPDKTIYRLTESGERALRTSLVTLPMDGRSGHAIFEFNVFFGAVMGDEHVRRTIEARRQANIERQAMLRRVERGADPDEDLFPLLTLELALEYHRAFVRWANRALTRLDERAATQQKSPRRRAK